MVNIALTEAEAATLKEVLQGYLSDLRMEIAGTNAMDMREQLEDQEDLLKRLLGQLAGQQIAEGVRE